jgi:hypothetical protein
VKWTHIKKQIRQKVLMKTLHGQVTDFNGEEKERKQREDEEET